MILLSGIYLPQRLFLANESYKEIKNCADFVDLGPYHPVNNGDYILYIYVCPWNEFYRFESIIKVDSKQCCMTHISYPKLVYERDHRHTS